MATLTILIIETHFVLFAPGPFGPLIPLVPFIAFWFLGPLVALSPIRRARFASFSLVETFFEGLVVTVGARYVGARISNPIFGEPHPNTIFVA